MAWGADRAAAVPLTVIWDAHVERCCFPARANEKVFLIQFFISLVNLHVFCSSICLFLHFACSDIPPICINRLPD